MPRSAARTVGCAVLLASVEVHAFLAKAPRSFARAARRAARPHHDERDAQSTTRRSLAGAMGVMAASLATSASAAPVGPWALSEFLDAVEKDSVERVTFDDAGKALVAVDADGGRHRVEILPPRARRSSPRCASTPCSSRSSRRRRTRSRAWGPLSGTCSSLCCS